MKMKELFYKIQPPCGECPYKLGLVSVTVYPCPQCKQNGYDFYERLLKLPWEEKTSESGKKKV